MSEQRFCRSRIRRIHNNKDDPDSVAVWHFSSYLNLIERNQR